MKITRKQIRNIIKEAYTSSTYRGRYGGNSYSSHGGGYGGDGEQGAIEDMVTSYLEDWEDDYPGTVWNFLYQKGDYYPDDPKVIRAVYKVYKYWGKTVPDNGSNY